MIIKCYRCGKGIESPGSHNADYVIANDTIVTEEVELVVVKKHNVVTRTLVEEGKTPREEDYDEEEFTCISEINVNKGDIASIKGEKRMKPVQKTGIVCPDCYRPTDTVIWGVHKK